MTIRQTRRIVRTALLALGIPLVAGCGSPASEHMNRARHALENGKPLEAMAALSHARELAPTDPDVQREMMRARAYLIAEQPARLTPEVLDELRYEASYLLETDPKHAAVYLTEQGNIAARTSDPGARMKFEEALKRDPDSIVAHLGLGLFLLNGKEGAAPGGVQAAAKEFEAILKVKPEHVVALVGLAQTQLAQGEASKAEENLEKALKQAEDFNARMLLGSAKLRDKKPAEAVQEFSRATELVSNNSVAWRSLGEALLQSDHPADAERALRQAAQLQQDAQTVLALGFALGRQKKYEQALGLFNSLIQQDENAAAALFGAGNVLEEVGKKNEALAYYKKIVALQPASQQQAQTLMTIKTQAQERANVIEGKGAPPSGAPR
jgi:tetratricopeptide (TPR) repeat protein